MREVEKATRAAQDRERMRERTYGDMDKLADRNAAIQKRLDAIALEYERTDLTAKDFNDLNKETEDLIDEQVQNQELE